MLKKGAYGLFKGCANYPECDYKVPLKATSGQVIKVLDGTSCPQCQQPLVLRQGKFGMFITCSDYPACHYSESAEKSSETENNITCPSCQKGHLCRRQSRLGKSFYGCDRYPDCRFILNATPHVGVCTFCQYPLLIKKKTASGDVLMCASKSCGKKVSDA